MTVSRGDFPDFDNTPTPGHFDADHDPDAPKGISAGGEACEAPEILRYRPFPTHLLPAVLGEFVRESAAAIGCDESMVAMPMLAVCAGAVGAARVIELKRSWREPLVIWAAVLSRSGTLKSPAFDAALAPLRRAQSEALQTHAIEAASYETALAEYEALKPREKAKAAKPRPPAPLRFLWGDVTVEALADSLQDNPRGGLVARDELSGWISSFNQYKGGRGGDKAAWLEFHRAGMVVVDRKTGDRRTIAVKRAAVSITGTIQPGVIEKLLSPELWESGMTARLLFCRPPDRRKAWTDRVPPKRVVDRYESLVRDLLRLQPSVTTDKESEPQILTLRPFAAEAWEKWYNAHAERQANAVSDPEAAVLSKLEGYAARFAGLFTLADNPHATEVDHDTLKRACALADWFVHESARIYAAMARAGDDDAEAVRELISFIERRGGICTARDIANATKRFGKSADVRTEINRLAEMGLGDWELTQGTGRPTERFILKTCTDETPAESLNSDGRADETPRCDSVNGGFVGANIVGAHENASLTIDPHAKPKTERADERSADETPTNAHAVGGFVGAPPEVEPNSQTIVGATPVVPNGWQPRAWATELRRKADTCCETAPQQAERFRRDAKLLDPCGARAERPDDCAG